MSQPRQQYVTLKTFISLLEYRRDEPIRLGISDYFRVTFQNGTDQEVQCVFRTDNWNALNLTQYVDPRPAACLIDELKVLAGADSHPDAAVMINNHLFAGFELIPITTHGLLKDTVLNRVSTILTPEELVARINDLKISRAEAVLDLAVDKSPKKYFTLYRVGDQWMTQADLIEAYPKISNYPFGDLFTWKARGSINVGECKISEAKMQYHFGLQTKNLIEQLLDEANAVAPMK